MNTVVNAKALNGRKGEQKGKKTLRLGFCIWKITKTMHYGRTRKLSFS